YLLVRIPLGLVAFLVTAVLFLVPVTLVLAPVLYLAGLALWRLRWMTSMGSPLSDAVTTGAHELGRALGIGREAQLAALVLSVVISALGVVILAGALHTVNGIAYAWGWFVRAMLGVNPRELQLAEARTAAAEARTRAERAESERRQLILDASHELR